MPGFEFFDQEEIKHIHDVMESGVLMRYNFDNMRNNHWKAKELEQAIADKFKIKYVHLTSSGTTALITAIKALGINAGDEIIIPTFTFVASFEAILFAGAIPVLVDVDDSLTLCPKSVEKAISPKTKAIMPVHMCGAMADMDSLMAIAKKHKLFIIEDACQATGATYNNQFLGTIGDIGCLSFDFVKTVTCGEGGAIMTRDLNFYNFSHQFSDHGHDHIGNDRGAENHPIIGLNFRISELHAAIGLAQWNKLDSFLEKQRKLKNIMKDKLANHDGIQFRKIFDQKGDNSSFLSIILKDDLTAETLAYKLKESNIPCAYWFKNNWHYIRGWNHFKNLKNNKQLYKKQRDSLPDYKNQDFSVSDEIMSKVISIPISLKWSENQAKEIAQTIIKLIQN